MTLESWRNHSHRSPSLLSSLLRSAWLFSICIPSLPLTCALTLSWPNNVLVFREASICSFWDAYTFAKLLAKFRLLYRNISCDIVEYIQLTKLFLLQIHWKKMCNVRVIEYRDIGGQYRAIDYNRLLCISLSWCTERCLRRLSSAFIAYP